MDHPLVALGPPVLGESKIMGQSNPFQFSAWTFGNLVQEHYLSWHLEIGKP